MAAIVCPPKNLDAHTEMAPEQVTRQCATKKVLISGSTFFGIDQADRNGDTSGNTILFFNS